MATKRRQPSESLKPTLEDNLQSEATQAAVKAMGAAFGDVFKGNYGKPVKALTRSQAEYVAIATISGWVKKRAEQVERGDDQSFDAADV